MNQVTTVIGDSGSVPTYSGESHEDLLNFLDDYELVARALSWNDDDRFLRLPIYLRDNARQWLRSIRPGMVPGRAIDTYEKMKHKMLKAMTRSDAAQEFYHKILNLKQLKGEPADI